MDPWHIHEAFTRILNLYWLFFDFSCNSRRTIFVRYNITINTNRAWIVSYHSFCSFLFFCHFHKKKKLKEKNKKKTYFFSFMAYALNSIHGKYSRKPKTERSNITISRGFFNRKQHSKIKFPPPDLDPIFRNDPSSRWLL